MDRRDFIKKTTMAAVGATVATPLAAMLAKTETAGLTENDVGQLSSEASPTAAPVDGKLKVLLINGSPRNDGNTQCALQEIATQLEKHGLATEIVQTGRGSVHPCVNCGSCHRKGKCVFDDDLCNRVAEKMAEAHALIVGSPVYYGQPNGGVLSLMQRLFYSAGRYVQDKPAAAVTVCRRGGATAAFQTLNMMFQMMNMPVVTSQYWNIVYGAGKGEAKLDSEGMQTMRSLAHNMAWLLKKIHAGDGDAPEREKDKVFMNFIR